LNLDWEYALNKKIQFEMLIWWKEKFEMIVIIFNDDIPSSCDENMLKETTDVIWNNEEKQNWKWFWKQSSTLNFEI